MNHVNTSIGLTIIGSVIIGGLILIKPFVTSNEQTNTSNAANINNVVTVAVDDWIGYIPFCSDYNVKLLRQRGIGLQCKNDNANYTLRMQNLTNGLVDLAMVEVGSYVVEGSDSQYPGVLIAAIDVSNGGDGIIGNKNVYNTIADLTADKSAKITYVEKSPSEFFALTTGLHFGLDHMKDSDDWKDGQLTIDEVKDQLEDGNTNVAVLWEPALTEMLNTGKYVKLVSTRDANNIIVDGLTSSRKFITEHPKLIKIILQTYFKSLRHFNEYPDSLITEVNEANPKLSVNEIKNMIKGVKWINLTENCKVWFGCDDSDWESGFGIVDTLDMAVKTWIEYGAFARSPLPNEDPYSLINSTYIKHLFVNGVDDGATVIGNPLETKFASLNDDQWSKLVQFGKMKTQPIQFNNGTNILRISGKEVLDDIVSNMKHYPTFRLQVNGHTGLRGDATKNKTLSLNRAKAVKRYLTRTYNIDTNRLHVNGFGGTRPLPIPNGMTKFSRGYSSKLARVDIVLVSQPY